MSTILITGANRGLGLEFVKEYLKDSWKVIACCRHPDKATELQKISHENLQIEKLDVTNQQSIQDLAKKLKNQAIDILLNNAGIYPKGTSEEEWIATFKTNTFAPFFMVQAFQEHVAASKLKIIADMSSLMGSIQDASGGSYVYRASKAALNCITKNLAVDLQSKQITVVSLSPGWVATDMGGPNANLTPEKSISGLKKVLSTLTLKDSGSFIHYDESKLPW